MRQKLGFAIAVALVLLSLSVELVCSDQTLVDEDKYLYPSGDPPTRCWGKNIALDAGATVSITITKQTGQREFEEFAISDSQDNNLYKKENVDSVQDQWTAPKSDTFYFFLCASRHSETNAHITITKTEGQAGGGGFDSLPIVAAVIVLLVWLVSVLLIVRMREQRPLSPPQEEPSPPPPA
jgi:hypothetical protein